jgi:hypothetical protein
VGTIGAGWGRHIGQVHARPRTSRKGACSGDVSVGCLSIIRAFVVVPVMVTTACPGSPRT